MRRSGWWVWIVQRVRWTGRVWGGKGPGIVGVMGIEKSLERRSRSLAV